MRSRHIVLSLLGLISFYFVVASFATTRHDKTRSNTLDWKPKEVIGAVEDPMDKKSGEVHFSVNLALEHTESKCLKDTEFFSIRVRADDHASVGSRFVYPLRVNHEREDSSCSIKIPLEKNTMMTCVWRRAFSLCTCHS